MNIPRFWARGNLDPSAAGGLPVSCWRWSNQSLADAQQQADARIAELAQLVQAGATLDRYAYGDRPLREEIVQTIRADSVLITRNGYGALVLNTSNAMFIDIDFSQPGASAPATGFLGRLFGSPGAVNPLDAALGKVREWSARRRDLGLRIYRTAAGLRILVTSRPIDAAGAGTTDLLREAASDPLYIQLCQAQSCFRARLTPKPWRCGLGQPPTRYPWADAQAETRFRRWQSDYDRAIQSYSVCQLIECIGPGRVHPEVAPTLSLHDQFACAPSGRQLA
jgi:hypothetical protein